MKCYRKVLHIPYTAHRTNESVEEDIVRSENYETLLFMIKRRKMKWLGHVSPHQKELKLANTIMHGRVPGKRGRGKPRNNWISNISNWTTMSIYDATKCTADRNTWRDFVNSQKVHLRLLGYGH
eukprot:gene15557-6822_t